MSRVCPVSHKRVMVGNNVSHSNNKTKRRFLPNLQNASFFSDVLNRPVRLRLTTSAIRTLELKGGIDGYLEKTSRSRLSPELLSLKKTFDKAKGLLTPSDSSAS
ncbi:MAG: 50S ribosomal protein L28 [Holosporales bacterium]|jgi:large subunit ribosomal protein L28|nr:50S ribosomal protein L28 [Holosporales bacterium]